MFFRKGGMLTGAEIERQIKKGNIKIDPYNPAQLNPNSYNLRLHPELAIYKRGSTRDDHIPTTNVVRIDMATGKHLRVDPDIFHECPFAESNELMPLDMNEENEVIRFNIPEEGYVLRPGVLYLGRTVEQTSTDKFIPMINGRSSGGRLGLSIHICAGFGDIGFDGTWTLEITVAEPLIIYPYKEIAQVCYFTPCGDTKMQYNGRYNKQIETTASRFYQPKKEVYDK